jgi:hypothetical protein
MKRFYLPIVLFIIATISACETDVDLIGDFQETTVVYGLLDQTQSVQYIRINKAFITSGNAYEEAKIQGIIEYDKEDIEARLLEMNGDELVRAIPLLEMDTVIDEGVFNNNIVLYYTADTLYEDFTYELDILVYGEKKVTVATELIRTIAITSPRINIPVYFTPLPNIVQSLKWRLADYAKLYTGSVSFIYKEKKVGEDTTYRQMNWTLGSYLAEDTEPSSSQIEEQLSYFTTSFYSICENIIPYEDEAEEQKVSIRIPVGIDYSLAVAAEEFYTYMELNNSSGIVQEKATYTNVENGIGIFSSRYNQTLHLSLDLKTVSELQKLGLKFELPV